MKLLFVSLAFAAMFVVAAPLARGQGTGDTLTPEVCGGLVEQYGIPDSDPAVTCQGGSLAAEHVAFCQSLAFAAGRDRSDLTFVFAARAILALAGVAMGWRRSGPGRQ